MVRQERAIRTRRAILEAAASLFDEHGYEGASTTDIIMRSGLTRGALYHHFPSKESIAVAWWTLSPKHWRHRSGTSGCSRSST